MSYIEVINAETVKFIQKSGELILQFRDFERNIYKIQSDSENVSSMDNSFGLSYHIFFGIIRNHTQGLSSWALSDEKQLIIEIFTNISKGAPDVKMEEWKFVFRNLEEQESAQGNITRVINPQQFCMNLSILMRSIMTLLVNTPLFKKRDQLKISRRIHFSKDTVRPFSPQSPLRLAHYSKTIYLLHHVFEFTLSYATDQPISTPSSWEQPQIHNFSTDSPDFSFGSFSLSNNLNFVPNSQQQHPQSQQIPQQQPQNSSKQQQQLPQLFYQIEQKHMPQNQQISLPAPPPNISSFSVYSQIESSLSPSLKKRTSSKKYHTELDIPGIEIPIAFQQQPEMMLFQTDPKNNLPEDQKISQQIPPTASLLKLSNLSNNQNSILKMDFSSVSSVGSPVSQVETSQSEIMSLPKSIISSPSQYPFKAPKKYSEDLTGYRKFKDKDESPKFQERQRNDYTIQDNEEKKESSFQQDYLNRQERERAQTVEGIQYQEENQIFETTKPLLSQTNTLQESIAQILSQLEQIGDPFLDKKKKTMRDVINSLI